jgi:prepilin-type processing-associated H-X9-DG protein
VVIGIIALLIGILLPALNVARQHANRIKCAANIRTLAMIDLQYASDNKGWVPRDANAGVPSWIQLLTTAAKVKLISNPVAGGGYESQYKGSYAGAGWLQCPSFPNDDQAVDYVVNAYDPSNVGNEVHFLRLYHVKRAGSTVSFAEANVRMPTNSYDVHDVWMTGHVQYVANGPAPAGGQQGDRLLADDRHRGMINLAYFDGHVDTRNYLLVSLADFVIP